MPNTVISTTAVNGDFSDIATALTDSLARDGQGGMTGAFRAIDGTVSLPGISFVSDPDSGIRRVTANELAVTVGGADALTINATNATFASGINVSMAGALAITGTQTITSTAGVPLTINNPLAGVGLSIRSTNTGAEGPAIDLYHDSASPAPADVIGAINFLGEDSAGNADNYARIRAIITDATSTSEDAEVRLQTVVAGTLTDQIIWPTPTFSANKNAVDQTGITSGAFVKITFTTEAFDIGGYYDTTNSRWTPPAGKYRISAVVRFTGANGVDNEDLFCSIFRNGVEFLSDVDHRAGITAQSTRISATVTANGTDFYEIFVFKSGAGAGTVDGRTTATWFCAEMI